MYVLPILQKFFFQRTSKVLTTAQHSYMKRYMADRYANTSIMKPEVLDGVSSHAKDFLKKCLEGNCANGYADIYVSAPLGLIFGH